MQDWAMDPEKDRIAKEEEEREKEERIEKDDPETLRKAREWDEYRDGKYFFSVSRPPSNCTADQHLRFRYTDSTIPLLLTTKFSSFYLISVTVHAGLCWPWSEPQIVFSCKGSLYNLNFTVSQTLSFPLFIFQITEEAGETDRTWDKRYFSRSKR